MTLSGKARVVTPCNGRPVDTRERDGNTVVPVERGPYGMQAFRASGGVEVVDWGNEPLGRSELAHMRSIIGETNARLANPRTALAITLQDLV